MALGGRLLRILCDIAYHSVDRGVVDVLFSPMVGYIGLSVESWFISLSSDFFVNLS